MSQRGRMRRWRDVGEGDIKIFLAHMIAMGLVQKACLEKYWDHGEIVGTAFLGHTWAGILFKLFCQIFKFLMQLWIYHIMIEDMTLCLKFGHSLTLLKDNLLECTSVGGISALTKAAWHGRGGFRSNVTTLLSQQSGILSYLKCLMQKLGM